MLFIKLSVFIKRKGLTESSSGVLPSLGGVGGCGGVVNSASLFCNSSLCSYFVAFQRTRHFNLSYVYAGGNSRNGVVCRSILASCIYLQSREFTPTNTFLVFQDTSHPLFASHRCRAVWAVASPLFGAWQKRSLANRPRKKKDHKPR